MALKNKRKKLKKQKTENTMFQDLPEARIARALWAKNKRVESARLFRKIVEKHPANIPALVDASRVMGKLFDYSRAADYLKTVLDVGARSARANFLAGQTYRILKQPRQAIECFNKSIELNPDYLDARLEVAILHERMGELEQSKFHIDRRLGINKEDHETLFLKSKLDRRLNNINDARNRLLGLTSNESVFWMTRARCCFELAKIHDQEQNYFEAWEAAKLGNELLSQHAFSQRERSEKHLPGLLQLADRFGPDHLRRWSSHPELELSNHVLLTGLPRSGTTLLANLLGADSCQSIVAADEFSVFAQLSYPLLIGNTSPQNLNLDFFDRASTNHIHLVRKSYRSSFQSIFPIWSLDNLLLDKNPSLFPLVIPYLATFPNGKLIIANRDPRDTFVSCFMTYMPVNDFTVDKVELEKAITRFESEWNYWYKVREAIPDNQKLEVSYEKLVGNTMTEITRCEKFLNVESTVDVSNYPHGVDPGTVHSPSYEDATQPVHNRAIGRWKNYEMFLKPVIDRLDCLVEKLVF